MASIRLTNLHKTYDNGHVAVANVNLDIADGEFLVLVGPSGCGKSTTLRMVAGLEQVTSGQIHIGDRLVNELDPGKRDIAMVFQNYALYPHMTVRQNMSFGLKMRKENKAEIKQRVDQTARLLSIETLLDRRPAELSGGQRQRVAVGRAIVRQPAAFLFDEPLSNLDAKLRVKMRKELAHLHKQLGTTAIYVTHDQVEAMTLGQRIVVMHDGKIQQVGTPMQIYTNPANRFVASFIGSPPMNLVAGNIAASGNQLVFQNDQLRFPLTTENESGAVDRSLDRLLDQLAENGEGCVLGFRPEHLVFSEEKSDGRSDDDLLLGQFSVDLVERFGDATMIYFAVARSECSARVSGSSSIQTGDTVTAYLPKSRWHLFANDPNGRLIATGMNGPEN